MAEFRFAPASVRDAERLVMAFHYSSRVPTNNVFVGALYEGSGGGLFGDEGVMVAAVFFGIPATRWREPVVELTRLVRRPDAVVPLTMLIAKSCRLLATKRLADLIVSFADQQHGHHGGVYQAASWRYAGCREAAMDGLMVNGVFVPGRSCNNYWGTRSPSKLRAKFPAWDIQPHYDAGKHLYWRALTNTGAAKAQRLGLLDLPYPKPRQAEKAA